MPAPTTSWNLVRLYGTWRAQDGSLRPGSYKITVPARITNHTDDAIIPAGIYAQGALQTASNGAPSLDVQVPATDDPDNDQTGWQLVVEVTFPDAAAEKYSIDVPIEARPVLDGGSGFGVNLRTVVLPVTIPPSNPMYRVGVAGGLARLDESGQVIDANGNVVAGGGGGGTTLTTYSQISGLSGYPTSFPPSTHTHAIADVTGLQTALSAAGGSFSGTFIKFSTLSGANDDAKLASAITAYQSVSLKGRTILLDENRDYTFTTQVTMPNGFSLQGTFRPQDQARSSLPLGNRILLRMAGASSGKGLFKINGTSTFGCSFTNLSIDADANSCLIDGSEDNGGVLWTSTFRDISMQNGKSVLGYTGNKLMVTACTIGGFWNINNIRDCAWNLGGSDFIANPEMMLVDSPPELLSFNNALMKFDFMTNMHFRGVYCTAEGHAALIITGSNSTSTALWFEDCPAIEGRNATHPSPGALVRVEGGQIMLRGNRYAYGMANPALITSRTDKGVIHVAGGNVTITDSVYERGNVVTAWNPSANPTPTVGGEVTEDVPFVYVAAGAKVRVRNVVGIGPSSGARSWVGKPVVKQAVAGSADVDSSVTLVTASSAVAPAAAGDTTTGFANTGTAVTINKPTNLITGDLLVAAVYSRNAGADFTSIPTGWTSVAPANGDNVPVGVVRIYYKNVTNAAGEPSTYTWSGGGSGRNVGVMTRVTGAINTSPIGVVGNNDVLISTPDRIILPSVTTTTDLPLLIMVGAINTTGGVVASVTLPDGGTVVGMANTNTGSSESSLTLAVQAGVATGATGTRRMSTSTTSSSGVGYMATIKSAG